MKTNRRFLAICFSLAGLILAISPNALAQRLGTFGDVLAPMMGGGWSMHQHAAPVPSLPPERAGDYKTLAGSLAKRLPHGTDLRSAAVGFRNLGDFVAAVHASDNLKVSFADMKARMMNGGTLHAAIADLRPQADAGIEARRARSAAFEELRQS
jgi:hypothetical protein